jgi:hypothetical protein
MLQGDANAPATMMRNMTTIFGDIIGEYVWVYLDDVVVFSQSVQEHMQHLREIFKRLQNASFYLKLSKCQLMQKSIKLLRHTIENGKILPAPEKIRRIMDWEIPKTKKQLQAFIGLVNYVAPHLLHAATVTAPLTELTGSNAEWNWDHLHTQAFNQLQRLSETHAPIRPLNYKDAKSGNTNVYLVTDASSVGTGAAICHGKNYEDAKSNIAALHSRKFTQAQIAYHTTDQEYLAVVDALKAFETKLLGIPFTVITDHQALVHMMNQEISTPWQMRWMNYMQRFEFRIQHQPGRTNMLADALSRLYEDIPKDRIGTEEMADGIKNEDDNEFSDKYLSTIEFPADEEIERELNLEDEAKLSNHHQSHAYTLPYRMSWQRPGNLYQRNADQASTTDTANLRKDAHGMEQQRLFQLIRSIWTNNDTTSNLKRMTKLTNPKDQTTRAELWYWDLYLKHLQSITTEDHQSRMQTKNHPAHSLKYRRTSSSDWTMMDSPSNAKGFIRRAPRQSKTV